MPKRVVPFMPHVIPSARASQSKHTSALSLLHVRLTIFEQALPDERLAQQELDVLLRPTLSRKRLQEHHDFLEVHLAEFVGPFHKESGAYVEVEGGEALIFGLFE